LLLIFINTIKGIKMYLLTLILTSYKFFNFRFFWSGYWSFGATVLSTTLIGTSAGCLLVFLFMRLALGGSVVRITTFGWFSAWSLYA
jgi:hypothetical protein